jgi:hypothetical protein
VAQLNPHELVIVYDKDEGRISLRFSDVHEFAGVLFAKLP